VSGIVAIVGRPNVGKSTLFNRLVGRRDAIVDDQSGVTRDRQYAQSEWLDNEFVVIDTGGYVPHSDDVFEAGIRNQVELAMQEADVLLFMADVTTGITDLDQSFAQLIRKANKPTLLIVNKVDNDDRLFESNEFYKLGFDNLYTVSSISGSGTGELLDEVVKHLPNANEAVDDNTLLPKIAIVGRPNVGKSSFCNVLLGEERNIVTDIPGTTRDTINTHYNVFGKDFLLVDTAGIRRKSKVSENVEFYSVMRSLRAVENADVCVIMLDAERGMEAQDVNLFGLAQKHGKGIVILVNKWDLVEKDTHSTKAFEAQIKEKISPFIDIPIVFISTLTKQRVFKAVETMIDVAKNMQFKIPTHKLNEFILPIIEHKPPPAKKGKYVRIKYVTQLPSKKVSFAFFCNLPQYIPDSYKRFLENHLRNEFNLSGVPIHLFFRKK
jgi:GTP-binding protein